MRLGLTITRLLSSDTTLRMPLPSVSRWCPTTASKMILAGRHSLAKWTPTRARAIDRGDATPNVSVSWHAAAFCYGRGQKAHGFPCFSRHFGTCVDKSHTWMPACTAATSTQLLFLCSNTIICAWPWHPHGNSQNARNVNIYRR